MIDLPMVSLIAYDNTECPDRTTRVMQYCRKFFNFGDSILICRKPPLKGSEDIRICHRDEQGYRAAMLAEFLLGEFVNTEYSFFVSHDGCILNPGKWNFDWLSYDFIGGPWRKDCVIDPRYRVGNTGFCLRSKKFMDVCASVANTLPEGCPADVFACQMMRPSFENDHGVKFAPVGVAADFSWDVNIDEYPNGRPDAFGGHQKIFRMTD